ncbi:PREDICTED: olfactory receptor 1009-like [Nanorana parkeri]|uniref:olfactory receptor 1009-like n=1 Tax=Nanorana parkeri TaxID=125878 RepID=UPI000854EF55|nr:PREDICTED: olfactory receptor 1009-like [Nanorana parkeri]
MDHNHTTVTEFILIGLSETAELKVLIFMVFLMIYLVTVIGNLCIILAYIFSLNLNTPMYFLLTNFSFLEICYISVNIPKMLSNLLLEHKTISFYGCALQVYSFGVCGGTECYLLAAMAYDRYNAICHPLLYSIIMNRMVCIRLVIGSYLVGSSNSLLHTVLTFTLPFCGSNKINHIFCDIPPILTLACADTRINQIVIFVTSNCVVVGSFLLIMVSYIYIILAVVRVHSTSGRKKAFSTCTSHFTVVTIFYGSVMFMYLKPESSSAIVQDKLVAVMYTVIAPLLNPFIYSLRNRDVKMALIKIYHQLTTSKKHLV